MGEDALSAVCDTLHGLECPLLEGTSTPWLREVLLQPSRHRTALLHWCCLQIEPTLAPRLPDPADAAAVRQALAGLGFCRRDSALLKEALTAASGAALWRPLLNVTAVLRQEILQPVTLPAEQALLTELCRSDQLQEALRSRPDLIAADLRQELDAEPPPEPAELGRAAAAAGRQLAELDDRLSRLQGGRPRADDRQLAALRQLCERTCCLLSETRRQLSHVRPRLEAAPAPPPPLSKLGALLAQSEETYTQMERAIEDARAVAAAKAAPAPAATTSADCNTHKLVADLGRLTAALSM